MAESDIGKRIHDLRIHKGMTLEEVANVVGVGKSTVRKWEVGMIANMKADKIEALAKAFSVPIVYIMGTSDSQIADTPPPIDTSQVEDATHGLSFAEKKLLAQQLVLNTADEDKLHKIIALLQEHGKL